MTNSTIFGLNENENRLSEAGDTYICDFEQYSYRAGDELLFGSIPFTEDDEEENVLEIPKKIPKPLKNFKIKFVWKYREGATNWEEHELNLAAKSIKQACFKVHEKIRQKGKDLVFYKIIGTWEMRFLPGSSSVYDLKQVKA